MLIFVVDDHALIRSGLIQALRGAGHNVVGEAATLQEAKSSLKFVQPDLLIVDVNLPDGSGLDLVTPDRKAIVLTTGDDPKALSIAYDRGACAYVLKGEPISHLLTVIDQVAAKNYLFERPKSVIDPFDLTQRELQVLAALHEGWSAKAIASHLFLAEATVKTHLAAIYRKLGVQNRTQAVLLAIKSGLIREK